jgi:hypothetical protein
MEDRGARLIVRLGAPITRRKNLEFPAERTPAFAAGTW